MSKLWSSLTPVLVTLNKSWLEVVQADRTKDNWLLESILYCCTVILKHEIRDEIEKLGYREAHFYIWLYALHVLWLATGEQILGCVGNMVLVIKGYIDPVVYCIPFNSTQFCNITQYMKQWKCFLRFPPIVWKYACLWDSVCYMMDWSPVQGMFPAFTLCELEIHSSRPPVHSR